MTNKGELLECSLYFFFTVIEICEDILNFVIGSEHIYLLQELIPAAMSSSMRIQAKNILSFIF